MPAFSAAIAACVSPSQRVWSSPMLVITLASGVTMFVASSRPPKPVSHSTMSHDCSAKWHSAVTTATSKNVGPWPSGNPAAESRSCAVSRASVPSGINSRFTCIRSRNDTRCGEVNSPVRRPASR